MQDDSPQPVLERIARGDQRAVEQCIAQYGALVWAIARRLTRGNADAEDAVQEIFTDVWRSAHRYQPALGSEKVFITTIARRRLIDRLRRDAQRPPMDPQEVLDELGFHSPGDAGEVSWEAERAAQALGELRPEQRRVIELGLLHGLTHTEIAAATGMPLGTVKTFMRRGLIQVRDRLGIQVGPGEGDA
jgi:RNA polymerase sigma-70 factor (ECF subfamily)